MVKQRMTALDVRASVEEMQSELRGLRLLNIYDISSKMFLFKFGHGENKKTLLLESGVRLHLTQLVREKPKVPSQFTLQLRKFVRAWRLDSVTQLQHDRTIDFRFGVGEGASYHIIIELFSKGNVVLTDHDYRILLLLRTHRDDDIKMFVRELYPVTKPFEEQEQQQREETEKEEEESKIAMSVEERRAHRTEVLRKEWHTVFARHADCETMRSTLSAVHHFGPALADHILTVVGVKNVKKGNMTSDAETMFTQLLPGMLEAWDIAISSLPKGGYLISNQKQGKKHKKENTMGANNSMEEGGGDNAQEALRTVRYDDFSPILLAQYNEPGVVTSFLDSFGTVCDAFFLYTESEKIEQHNEKKAASVLSKKDRFERDHKRRLNNLEAEERENQRKGECIMQNAEKIDEAIGLINGALAAGIQWDALRTLLKRRHAEGHPVAYMVHELFLERNSISVLVEESNYQEDEEYDAEEEENDNDRAPLVIEVDLSKTAYANATTYFSKKKANRAKYEKTVASTAKAMAGAEKKGERVAAKKATKKAIVKERRRCWWEKFSWFRTSCGDFVLQGKDTQMTEILVRRIMQLGDVFVHCDVDGALPCLLRPVGSAWTTAFMENDSNRQHDSHVKMCAIHMTSLDEAGAWCVSRSSAWESKYSVAAWWVHASQLTGGTASGCYLFDGEKHYLRPQPLTLACGLLFRITTRRIDPNDPEELPNFKPEGERRPLSEEEAETGNGAFLPPDIATALHTLPSVEEVRGHHRRTYHNHNQHQQQHNKSGHDAAQKRSTRAGVTTSVAQRTGEGREIHSAPPAPAPAPAANTPSSLQKNVQQLTKHQRKKLKKIQEKYKDQDEEDRLHGALLNGNQLSKVQMRLLSLQREKEKKPHESMSPVTMEGQNKGPDEEYESSKHEEVKDKAGLNNLSGSSSSCDAVDGKDDEGKKTEQGEEGDEEGNENEEKKIAKPRSDAVTTSAEELYAANNKELLGEWQCFTSRPQPTDNIEYAVFVSAPMSCLISYKYRAELSFGTAKKGQVTASLQGYFMSLTKGVENSSEVSAVQSLDGNGVMEQLRGNLKCVARGYTK